MDAGFIAQMMQALDLPNAAMTQWIAYIQLFTFEIQHNPGVMHQVPDGLSHMLLAEDDSDYSGDDIDIKDGIKVVKVLPAKNSQLEYEDHKQEESLQTEGYLARTRLNCVPGEVKVMETEWKLPAELRYDFRKMYVGEGKEFDLNEEDQKLNHPHQVQDKDEEGFWDDI